MTDVERRSALRAAMAVFNLMCFMARLGGWQPRCRVCGHPIDSGLPTPYCSPLCADRDADYHRDHHVQPTNDYFTWCDSCGGWVVVR